MLRSVHWGVQKFLWISRNAEKLFNRDRGSEKRFKQRKARTKSSEQAQLEEMNKTLKIILLKESSKEIFGWKEIAIF